MMRVYYVLFVVSSLSLRISAFSGKGFGKQDDTTFALFDRFRAVCPASLEAIRHYDMSLLNDSNDNGVWVAVYRSNNNKPSVLVKDEFLQAMKSATDSLNPPRVSDPGISENFVQSKERTVAPIAVACLRPDTTADYFVLDSMRCVLKKENTDASCDGGSEHTEAIATAIDAVIHHYLHSMMKGSCFEGVIRTKATLVSAPLLEERGFRPVQELQADMATHTSSLDDCLQQYAARSVSTDSSKSPGARLRAMEIVSKLGRIDRAADFERAQERIDDDESNRDEYDPWSSMRQFL